MQHLDWSNPEKVFNDWVKEMESKGFVLPPGKLSIHSIEAIKFWEKELRAEDWVLNILQHGLKPDFHNPPPNYAEENNRSAIKNMTLLKAKVAEWEKEGYVQKCISPPPFLNPMTVAEKIDLELGRTKYRPCIDMSRCLNKRVNKTKVTLDSLSNCEKLLLIDDFQTVFDLENMYFHIKLHQDSRKYFGFSLPADKGGKDYYTFNIMCYGFAAAVTTVTRMVTPIKPIYMTLESGLIYI